MDEQQLTQLAAALGVEPTVEALKSALEQVIAVLDGGEAEPTEEQQQYAEAMRSAFGVETNEAVLYTLTNIKSLLEATEGVEDGEQGEAQSISVDLAELAAIGATVNEAAKNAKNQTLRIPRLSQSGKKSNRYNTFGINKGAERPGLMTLINGMLEQDNKKIASATKAAGVSENVLGGYLVRDEISQEIIDPLYASEVVMAAGAEVIPMDGIETLTIAKDNTSTTAHWAGEHLTVGQSDVDYGVVRLSLKELVAEHRISRRLLRSARANIEQRIRNDIIKKMRLKMDYSFLFGSGAVPSGDTGAEPTGLVNLVNSTSYSSQNSALGSGNGAKPKLTDTSAMYLGLMNRDVEASDQWGFIMHPSINEYFNNLTATDGNPLLREDWNSMERPQLQGYPRYTTTQVPITQTVGTSTDCSTLFFGDWSQAVIGMGMDVEFAVDESVYRRERDVLIQAVLMVDFAIKRTEAFEIRTGVRS